MDCLWRPKCLKFGWYPTYQPSPFEEKIWKRFYVSTVHELNFAKMKVSLKNAACKDSGKIANASEMISVCANIRYYSILQRKNKATEKKFFVFNHTFAA